MVVGSVFLGAIQAATALDTDPLQVDESPALAIGNFEVSHYILDKNYNQFVATHRAKSGKPPAPDEIAAWFRLFIARLAIQARLVEEGYLTRPEVQREVSRMSRQILTQADGPLYNSLLTADEFTPERLRALHDTSARVFDVLMVRFDDAAVAAQLLGPVDTAEGFEQAVKTLGGPATNSEFDLSEGPTTWPYGIFQEIADAIPAAPHGTMIGPLSRALGVYYLLVRSESKRAVPDFEATRGQWEQYVRWLSLNLVQRVRRCRLLDECEFQSDLATVARLAPRIRPADVGMHTIDERALLDDAEEILATYKTPGGRSPITVRDFVRHFNQRIIRSMPRDTAALVSAIEDIVVEEYDHAAALVARFDQESKFVQDRRNFELKQALEFYENEVLAPQIPVSPAEIRAYYDQRSARYEVVSEATGVLYKFTSSAAVNEALPMLNRGENTRAVTHAEQVVDPIVVRREGPSLATGRPNALLLAMPDGQPFGPFEHEGRQAVFVKRSSGPKRAHPLAEIENVIRLDLMREKLDAREEQLFAERGHGYALRLLIEFSKYGIENPFRREAPAPEARATHRLTSSSLTP